MPEGFGYGGDEVEATTRNKTVKRTTSQLEDEGRLIKRGIGTETPQQQQFRREVDRSVTDPSTRQDVLKAAGLPGTGLTSKPAAKPAPKPAAKPTPRPGSRGALKRYRDMLRAAGVPERRIQAYMRVQFGEVAEGERRAERREKFLRRQAAEKYGTPP